MQILDRDIMRSTVSSNKCCPSATDHQGGRTEAMLLAKVYDSRLLERGKCKVIGDNYYFI
jgi:hypothetical protein